MKQNNAVLGSIVYNAVLAPGDFLRVILQLVYACKSLNMNVVVRQLEPSLFVERHDRYEQIKRAILWVHL